MDEMKSALERAMERADSLGKASEEEVRRWKYLPEGEKLAVRYLADEGDLLSGLDKYDEEVRRDVIVGVQQVLVRNLDLPRNDVAKKKNRKAMEAIKELKRDKVSVENVYTKVRRLFNHYEQEGEQQRRQLYEDVKRGVEAKMRQAMQQQLGAAAPGRLNVESQPLFQEELRRSLGQLDLQYMKLLDEYKQELLAVS